MEAKQLSVCHRTRSRGCRSWEEREQEAKRALQATDLAWARRLGGGVCGGRGFAGLTGVGAGLLT